MGVSIVFGNDFGRNKILKQLVCWLSKTFKDVARKELGIVFVNLL